MVVTDGLRMCAGPAEGWRRCARTSAGGKVEDMQRRSKGRVSKGQAEAEEAWKGA